MIIVMHILSPSPSPSSSALLRAARLVRLSSSLSRASLSSPHSLIKCPPLSFPSALRPLRSSAPRWSHGGDCRSPVRAQIITERKISTMASGNPFKGIFTNLPKPGGGEFGKFYSLPALNDARIDVLPYSIRILLESAIRNCDNFQVTTADVAKIIDWENTSPKHVEIPFKPARVLLQDFTGVPAVVDLAAMRNAMNELGSDTNKINPLVDVARNENAVLLNMELEFQRNKQRFAFLKWGSTAFRNMLVVPPGSGIVHQGKLRNGVTATDLVLTVTQMLRKHGVVGKFVEFYGEGMGELSLANRAAIANMSPEYGATMGFFPVDHVTLQYLKLTGRSDETVANGIISKPLQKGVFSSYLELDLADVEPCVSGPKSGFGVPKEEQDKVAKFLFHGQPVELKHGSVVIAAITSCTNTSNPSVMLGAGLVAKKACALGLEIKPWIKTSLAPGSGVVTIFAAEVLNFVSGFGVCSGLQKYLNWQGFHIVGHGCTTCIGNSGELDESVASAISENILLQLLCFLETETLKVVFIHSQEQTILLRLPYNEEIAEGVTKRTYEAITKGNPMWNSLSVPSSSLYAWDPNSTYIHEPPFFKGMAIDPPGPHGVKDAHCLLKFGDSITTDHISPAGSIHKDSPAAKYLLGRGVHPKDFNSYGSRRGNDEVMVRGTFANIRLVNKLLNGEVGPKTIHIPTGEKLHVFDAAMRYKATGQDTIVLAGAEYGSDSSRDWTAKGPMLQGVKAVIAKSFERIHCSNLVGMNIIPLCFKPGQDADTLGLTGHERYTIDLPSKVREIRPGQDVNVTTDTGKSFTCTLRFDTEVELSYFDHGGILPYVIRNLIKH
ncbi:unnamed protein product [Camellia sinensis]